MADKTEPQQETSLHERLLEITTVKTEQRIVRIDGVDYPMQAAGDFDLPAYVRIKVIEPLAMEIRNFQKFDVKKAAEVSDAVTAYVKEILIGASDEVINKLTIMQRVRVLQHFLAQPAPITPVTGRRPKLTAKALRQKRLKSSRH